MSGYIELRICEEVVRLLLQAGFAISVNDNDADRETHVERSTDQQAIMAALFNPDLDACDYCLDCWKDGKPDAEGHSFGFVRLIAGNGTSVISDYSTALEDVIAPANALANEIDRDEEGWCRRELEIRAGLIEAIRPLAAAPDLLEQLTLALPYVESALEDRCYKPNSIKIRTAAIRAAIAKATGAA